jgi:PhnB protein
MKKKVMQKKVTQKKAAAPKKKVKPIPEGYHAVTPYLSVRGAARAIEFYKQAFGAAEIMRMPGPEGKLGHAEIRIGDSRVMLSDEYPPLAFLSPESRGGTTVHIHLYVKDVDAVAEKALAAGGKLLRPVADQFYGDRTGSIEDPFGHIWHLATHTEDLSPAEMRRRAEEAAKRPGGH